MRVIRRALILLLLCPLATFAHVDHAGGGFVAGISHPVLGPDHFLAMLSVGILSAQIGGHAIWTVPLTFVSVMVLGGIVGIAGIVIPAVEYGIAVSVLALGIAIAAEKKMPTVIAMYGVGLFAVFHGHAHGSEMPNLAKPALYTLGFVAGTAGIHVAGVLIGILSDRMKAGAGLLRIAGAGIAAIGVYMLAQV